MTWQGGFSGVGFASRAEFRKWLRSQPKPAYQRVVIHNTAAPYIVPPVLPSKRVQNIAVHYKKQGWSAGPDFFVFPAGVYLGSPLGKSVGCKGWNGNSFHVECEGDYDGTHDPLTGDGLKAWTVMAWVVAEILDWMGWVPNGEAVKLHKEGLTTHQCPGKLVDKRRDGDADQRPFQPGGPLSILGRHVRGASDQGSSRTAAQPMAGT